MMTRVWSFLIALTAVEVFLAYIHASPALMLTVLLVLSTVKAFYIIGYFMHMKFERPRLAGALFPITILLILSLLMLLPDAAHAQCVMCARTAEAQSEARQQVLNQAILILMAPPLFILTGILLFAAQPDLQKLLHAVETRYNDLRTLQLSFEQSMSGLGRIKRIESGTLAYMRPGRMFWKYQQPEGKFLLVDGKFAYFYSPSNQEVVKTQLKDSEDLRAPLAFLIGRLDFNRDFKEFRTIPEGPDTYIVATPKSAKAPYTQVAFLVNSKAQILRLRITGQDQSIMVYNFADEKINDKLDASMFYFRLPAGAQLIENEN